MCGIRNEAECLGGDVELPRRIRQYDVADFPWVIVGPEEREPMPEPAIGSV